MGDLKARLKLPYKINPSLSPFYKGRKEKKARLKPYPTNKNPPCMLKFSYNILKLNL